MADPAAVAGGILYGVEKAIEGTVLAVKGMLA
jgi:hypothetical protein